MDKELRQTSFEALVLQGIWVIICILVGQKTKLASNWRSNAIFHLDNVGNQSDGAKKHRREIAFPYPGE